jgi:hypothetical protein
MLRSTLSCGDYHLWSKRVVKKRLIPQAAEDVRGGATGDGVSSYIIQPTADGSIFP